MSKVDYLTDDVSEWATCMEHLGSFLWPLSICASGCRALQGMYLHFTCGLEIEMRDSRHNVTRGVIEFS
jgi:hypothetical protein